MELSVQLCTFRDCNKELYPADATAGNGILTKATVPIYATGVLTCYNQVGVSQYAWYMMS